MELCRSCRVLHHGVFQFGPKGRVDKMSRLIHGLFFSGVLGRTQFDEKFRNWDNQGNIRIGNPSLTP